MTTVSESLRSMAPGPSEIERRKLFDASSKQIESFRKKELLRARDLCVKEELSDLERQINSAADGMLKELHALYQSSACTDKKMAEFAESNVRSLEGMSTVAAIHARAFGRGGCSLESTAEAVRSTISSSSIDFSAFVPTVSDVVHTGVIGATGYALASLGAGLEAERLYSSSLLKFGETSANLIHADYAHENALELAEHKHGVLKRTGNRIWRDTSLVRHKANKAFEANTDALADVKVKAARGGKHFRKIKGGIGGIGAIFFVNGLEYVVEKLSTPASPAE